MASFVDLFNATASTNTYNKTLKLEDLEQGTQYSIQSGRVVNTKYGKSVVLTLCDPDSQENFDVFLPKKFVETFEKSESIPENLKLIRGKPMGSSFELKVIRK